MELDKIKNNKLYLLISALVCVLLFFLLIRSLFLQSPYLSINMDFYLLIKKLQNDYLYWMSIFFSLFGDRYIVIPTFVITSVMLFGKKEQWLALHLIGVVLIAAFLAHVLKNAIAYPRPEISTSALPSYAFPSRHVTLCSAYVTFLSALIIPQISSRWLGIIIAWLIVIIESMARIVLQVHWLTDVIGGALLGAACGFLGAYSFFLKPKTSIDIKSTLTTLLIVFLVISVLYSMVIYLVELKLF
ncbi:phosphatase PAP2 family protein [Legionella resiliens]|uniref:undecaprenyl-diphosphate phosphatase n=1 Tax=Legionella resiliens TaxID=2905958 RepID=A0ABS8X157_9GAMM|nr:MULTISPECIES: phosphatase PAP2 family protein [unclassified Legionella]MCE0722559.1 phosphatase PAP2 family protein [Legionella sp. 9fVS26]MCE3531712.1 phosphatase PAP2 family protein [Legionella sp. 8cVS16]